MPSSHETTHQARSNSSPTELHPYLSEFSNHFLRLESYKDAPNSSTSISHKLTGLIGLQGCVSNVLQLASVQKDLTREWNKKSIEGLLEGSLWLIDVCDFIRGILMQTKEGMCKLQSVVRRRTHEDEISKEASLYFGSRNEVKKRATRVLEQAKCLRKRFDAKSYEGNNDTVSLVCFLEESELVSVNVLESVFSYVASPRIVSRTYKWSLVGKLASSKQVSQETEENSQGNKFEEVDDAIQLMISQKEAKSRNNLQFGKLKFQLEELESIAQELEGFIECLSMHFIRHLTQIITALPPPPSS